MIEWKYAYDFSPGDLLTGNVRYAVTGEDGKQEAFKNALVIGREENWKFNRVKLLLKSNVIVITCSVILEYEVYSNE
jgi:hypothetical protein